MLPVLGVMVAAVALLAIFVGGMSYWLMIGVMALFGGLIFAVYPVAVARAHDLFEQKDIVPVSSCLLLSYGVGAALGPVGASTVMTMTGSPYGFLMFVAMIAGVYAVVTWVLRRIEKVEIVPVGSSGQLRPHGEHLQDRPANGPSRRARGKEPMRAR